MKLKPLPNSYLSYSINALPNSATKSDRRYLHFRNFRSILKHIQTPNHIKRFKYISMRLRVRRYPAVWGTSLPYLDPQVYSGTAGSMSAPGYFLTSKNSISSLDTTSGMENHYDENIQDNSNNLINLRKDCATYSFFARKSTTYSRRRSSISTIQAPNSACDGASRRTSSHQSGPAVALSERKD
jgi:hypothetical protein